MRKKFWQTDHFKRLQREWDDRLKQTGFRDIESNGELKRRASGAYRTSNHTIIESKRLYFDIIGQRHHEEDFSDPVEKYVMSRRAEGISIKQIGIELRAAKKKNSRETIRKIIRFFEYKWGLRKKKRL